MNVENRKGGNESIEMTEDKTEEKDGIKEADAPEEDKSRRNYLMFVIIYAVVTLAVTLGLTLTGLKGKPYIPAENPYYTEHVNYPPAGAIRVALIAFFISSFVYVLCDYLFFYKFKGRKKIIAVVGSVIFIMLSIENSVTFFTTANPPLHVPHPVYLWRLYPNHHGATMLGGEVKRLDVNRHGFRGPDVKRKKPKGVFRIMILGDSSAFGYGVAQKEVFARRLESKLSEEYPKEKIQVINAAVPGYTTYSSRAFFVNEGVKFEPDVLIIAHNNDPDVDWDSDANRALKGLPSPFLRFLYRSNIYMLLRKMVLNRRLSNAKHLYERPPEGRGVRRVSQKELQDNLEAIITAAKDAGARLMIISMPRNEDVDEAVIEYRGIMKKSAKDAGGSFLNLLEKWDEDDGFFIDDMHPNARGHEKLADDVAERLVQLGWLKGDGKNKD